MIDDNEASTGRTDAAAADQTKAVAGYEAELTRRSEQLRDLQRAKAELTASVSRDFRAPITMLLGPLQDLLDSPASALAPSGRAVLEEARPHSLPLLQLVDAQSDPFTPGGGSPVADAPADLASRTADLAGYFHAACNAAGLRLIIDCPPLPYPPAIASDAWDKIVLNLVAHAFKSTVHGTIEVRLRAVAGYLQLAVTDAGAGLSEQQARYVLDAVGRGTAAEGDQMIRSSFGLPLVRDLVRLYR